MKKKIPKEFQPILWSYDFSLIDPDKDKKRIIINVVNYGNWRHWQWIVKQYGQPEVKRIIQETPITEFRNRALKLISLLLNIKNFKYAFRSINSRS